MNALQQFLLNSNVKDLKKTINLGGRMAEHPITIRALDGDKYNTFQQMCIENPNSAKKRRFNSKKFNELICIECLVDPNMRDAEFLKVAREKIGVADSAGLLYHCFLAGEIAVIAEQALKLSGFDRDVEEEIDEVKNS
jgi:hypothetical protein